MIHSKVYLLYRVKQNNMPKRSFNRQLNDFLPFNTQENKTFKHRYKFLMGDFSSTKRLNRMLPHGFQ